MCMALIVGFSVDYIVHLAHAYVHEHEGASQHHYTIHHSNNQQQIIDTLPTNRHTASTCRVYADA